MTRAEMLIFIAAIIILMGALYMIDYQNDVIKEQAGVINDQAFLILGKDFDLAESKRQNARLGDNDYFYPVDKPVISSDMGMRISPITGYSLMHYGTDMYSNYTMNVYAVKDGEVITHYPPPDGYHRGHPKFGGYIEIVDSYGISTYGHMSTTLVKEGQQVKAGDIIGIIGDTGLSVGKHLHFTYYLNIFKGV